MTWATRLQAKVHREVKDFLSRESPRGELSSVGAGAAVREAAAQKDAGAESKSESVGVGADGELAERLASQDKRDRELQLVWRVLFFVIGLSLLAALFSLEQRL
jgi:hypothetical protein